jgi:hypothetical protein
MKATVYHAIRMNPLPDTSVAVDLTKFKKVAEVEDGTTNKNAMLNIAFRDTNHIDESWTENSNVTAFGDVNRLRSTSVGDLVEIDGTFVMCDVVGWVKVNVLETA